MSLRLSMAAAAAGVANLTACGQADVDGMATDGSYGQPTVEATIISGVPKHGFHIITIPASEIDNRETNLTCVALSAGDYAGSGYGLDCDW